MYYSHNMQISCSFTCRIMKVLFSIYIVFGCIWSSLAAFKSLDRKQSQFQTLISGGLTFSTPQLVQPSPVARQRHQGFPRLGAKKRRTRPCSCESETWRLDDHFAFPCCPIVDESYVVGRVLDACCKLAHQSLMPLIPRSNPGLQ